MSSKKKGGHLKVEQFGDDCMGVTIHGDPNKPEPTFFIVKVPGGHVEITRTSDNDYWIHAARNNADHVVATGALVGQLVDGRIDVEGMHSSDVDQGDIRHPDVDHMAVRIAVKRTTKKKIPKGR